MYPWLRVMYAVVVIGSRMRRSACGMNLSTFLPLRQRGRSGQHCSHDERADHTRHRKR